MYYLKFPLNLLRLVGVACLLFVQACSDDDDPKDSTPPEISFANLAAGGTVWNIVEIKLEGSDDLGLASIEIFVGDDLIATLTDPPYEFSWDSNEVPDGSHTIKVVATDKSGNQKRAEVTITVKNTLLSVDIASDQLYKDEEVIQRGFIFLSDEDGKVIAFTEYTNGVDVALTGPDFDGDKFYLTEIVADVEAGTYTWVRAFTWSGLERGSTWVLGRETEQEDEYIGSAEITAQNPKAQTWYDGSTNGDFVYFDIDNWTRSPRLRKSPSKLFLKGTTWNGEKDEYKFGMFSDIVLGSNTINLNLVNTPFTVFTLNIPEGTDYFATYIDGFLQEGDYSERYSVGFHMPGEEPNTKDIYYPGNTFPSYYTETIMDTPEMYYSSGTRTFMPNLEIPEHNISIETTASGLQYSATGDFDFFTTRFENGSGNFRWIFALPVAADQTIPVLELPDDIQGLPLPEWGEPKTFYLYEFESIDGYEGLKEFVKSSTVGTDELYDGHPVYVDIEFYLTPEEGRVKADVNKNEKKVSDLRFKHRR